MKLYNWCNERPPAELCSPTPSSPDPNPLFMCVLVYYCISATFLLHVCVRKWTLHIYRECVCFFHLKPIPQPTAWDVDGFDLQLAFLSLSQLKACLSSVAVRLKRKYGSECNKLTGLTAPHWSHVDWPFCHFCAQIKHSFGEGRWYLLRFVSKSNFGFNIFRFQWKCV